MNQHLRLLVLSAVALVFVASGCVAAPMVEQADTTCAWSTELLGAELDSEHPTNLVFPDTSANYWMSQVPMGPSTELTISGNVSDVRYWSLHTYVGGDGFTSALDHVNDASISSEADGSWKVRITPEGGSDANHLAGLPAGRDAGISWVVLRSYLPDDASLPIGPHELPTIQISSGRSGVTLELCDPHRVVSPVTRIPEPTEGSGSETPVQRPLSFSRTPSAATPFPNADTAYLAAPAVRLEGSVLVVRGRAPSFPGDGTGATTESAQLRYWSFCQFGIPSTSAVECVSDSDVPLDESGYYTIVVSDPSDRPQNADTQHDVAWLPWGREVQAQIGLRNMLPSADFDASAFAVPTRSIADDTNMGDFAPRAAMCPTAVFEASGHSGCGLA